MRAPMSKVEAYDLAVLSFGAAAGVVELGPGRCLVGRWRLSTPIGEGVGPYVLATSRHVVVVLGEGETFEAAILDAQARRRRELAAAGIAERAAE